MQQLARIPKLATVARIPAHKRIIEDDDLQVVADLICAGIKEGHYVDMFPSRKRSDVVAFLRRLVTKCETEERDASGRISRRRAAALFVYSRNGAVVGFSVLAQVASKSLTRGIELLMLGVAPVQRGLGYGTRILDGLIKQVSDRCFDLTVNCPSNNRLFFAMLLMRGFFAADRRGKDRVLCFLPARRETRGLEFFAARRDGRLLEFRDRDASRCGRPDAGP